MGDIISRVLINLMKETGMPNGLRAVGFTEQDIPLLVEGAWPQRRVIENAPLQVTKEDLAQIYKDAMQYW